MEGVRRPGRLTYTLAACEASLRYCLKVPLAPLGLACRGGLPPDPKGPALALQDLPGPGVGPLQAAEGLHEDLRTRCPSRGREA